MEPRLREVALFGQKKSQRNLGSNLYPIPVLVDPLQGFDGALVHPLELFKRLLNVLGVDSIESQ